MPEPIDLNLVCAESRAMLTQAVGPDIHLKIEVTSAPCLVLGERAEIEQLLLDLVLKIRQGMAAGGVLTIRLLSVVEVPPGLRPPHVRAKSFARIVVSDARSGGMPAMVDLPCVERPEDSSEV